MATRPSFDVVYEGIAARDFFAGGFVCVPIPRAMIPLILGALDPFTWPDAYNGEIEAAVTSSRQVDTFRVDLAALNECSPDEVIRFVERAVCGGVLVVEDEDNMGQVVTKVSVQDGVLRVEYGPCCVEEFVIGTGGQTGLPDPDGDNPIVFPSIPGWDSTACVKATRYVRRLAAMIGEMFDSIDDLDAPWTTLARVKDSIPEDVSISELGFADAYSAALVVTASDIIDETRNLKLLTYDDETQQALICAFVNLLSDEQTGMTEDQYTAVLSAIQGTLSKRFTILEYPLSANQHIQVWYGLAKGLGKGDSRDLTAYLAPEGDEDCSCGEGPSYAGYTTRVMQWDFSFFNPNTTEVHDVALTGNSPLQQDWVLAVYEWEGECPVNGAVRAADAGGTPIVGTYTAPFSGIFVRWVGTVGQGLAQAFFDGVTGTAVVMGSEYADGIITLSTTGNNVTVVSSGTLTLFYPEEE